MSIAMLQDPFKPHDILDDMESIFWSLLIGAAKYFAGKIQISMEDFFYQKTKLIDGRLYVVGGNLKRDLLADDLSDMPFDCVPLRDLITRLSNIWRNYYRIRSDVKPTSTDSEAQAEFKQLREQLSKPAYWIAIFDEALARKDWLKADTIEDRYPSKSDKEADMQDRDQHFVSVVDVETFLNNVKDKKNDPSSSLTKPSDSDASRSSSPLSDVPDSQDAVFPAIHPGPPQTVSNRSGSEISMQSYQWNSNGKRTLSIREDDDNVGDRPADDHPTPADHMAKRLRRSLRAALKPSERSRSSSRERGGSLGRSGVNQGRTRTSV